jgi:hypothetical protein
MTVGGSRIWKFGIFRPRSQFCTKPLKQSHPKSHPNLLVTSSLQGHHHEGEHTMVDGQENSFPLGFIVPLILKLPTPRQSLNLMKK